MLEWIQTELSHFGYLAIFLGLFLNNLGVPLPGTTLLLSAGFLVGREELSFLGTVATALVACFMGSTCGYALGLRYGGHLLKKIPWMKLKHQRLRHMKHFFKRYGPAGVFFAWFVSILHPVIGLLSGVSKTPPRPFLFYNFVGSACYVLLYTLVGKYIGHKLGFHKLWQWHTVIWVMVLVLVIIGLSVFWQYSVYTFFGHPFYKKKRGGFWGR